MAKAVIDRPTTVLHTSSKKPLRRMIQEEELLWKQKIYHASQKNSGIILPLSLKEELVQLFS